MDIFSAEARRCEYGKGDEQPDDPTEADPHEVRNHEHAGVRVDVPELQNTYEDGHE